MKKYYLDTSIWLDLLENRNEFNFPKGEIAEKFIAKIIKENNKIIFSNVIIKEMINLGYSYFYIKTILKKYKFIILYINSLKKQIGRAKDLSLKRKVPLFDALHALIAQNNKATLITRDKHFKRMWDIIEIKTPEELIKY